MKASYVENLKFFHFKNTDIKQCESSLLYYIFQEEDGSG